MEMALEGKEQADRLLDALAQQLEAQSESFEIVVIGGAALLILGFVDRATRDVGIIALMKEGQLVRADPLPEALVAARDRVARDFDLLPTWINAGPTDILTWGLPVGFESRLVTRRYRDSLLVHVADRFDLIHFKLYALVDSGPGRHGTDLQALSPSREELIAAARWVRTQDPSVGFVRMLQRTLDYLGMADADIED